jgi:hypothetical protein
MASLEADAIAPLIRFAGGVDDFAAAINDAISQDDAAARQARMDAVAPYAWSRLFARLDELCTAALT